MESFRSTYQGEDQQAALQFKRLEEVLAGFRVRFAAPTLLNSWVNYGIGLSPAGYYKDPYGRVHLKGTIKSGTVTSGTVLFTLPAGFRPLETLIFPVDSNNAHGRVNVQANGDVVIILGNATHLSLSGISFAAE